MGTTMSKIFFSTMAAIFLLTGCVSTGPGPQKTQL